MSSWTVASIFNVVGARPLAECGWAATVDAVVDGGFLHFSGWVLHAAHTVTTLHAWSPMDEVTVTPALSSADVAGVYPTAPQAGRCRFAMSLPMQAIGSHLRSYAVSAINAVGERMHLATVLCRRHQSAATQIFVIGSPRSGTTAVGNALRLAMGLPNYGEAHVLPVLRGLMDSLDAQLDDPNVVQANRSLANMMAHLPAQEFRERLAEAFRNMYRQLHGSESFCDKTPGIPMLRAVTLAAWMWPNARFIFCKRRGLENIASRLRKFDGAPFEAHCHDWALTLQIWQELRPSLGTQRCFEVDQHDLQSQPETIGQHMAQWIGLPQDQVQQVVNYLRTERPERTSGELSPLRSIYDLGWGPDRVAQFRAICGPTMERYGYSEDQRYWR